MDTILIKRLFIEKFNSILNLDYNKIFNDDNQNMLEKNNVDPAELVYIIKETVNTIGTPIHVQPFRGEVSLNNIVTFIISLFK